jgi:riboflavin biosynthesis pyrimidine reductase
MSDPSNITLLPDDPDGIDQYYGNPPRGVRANMIFTADGAAAFRGRTKAISDPADQFLLGQLRTYADVILVGSGTVSAENYGPIRLSDEQRARREARGEMSDPRLAVVTAHGSLAPTLRIFTGDGPPPLIVTVSRALEDRPDLEQLGEAVIVGEETIDPAVMLEQFRKRGLDRVLCEGGPYMLTSLIDGDLVDDMCLTVSPYLAGSQPTTLQPASDRIAPTRLELRHALQRDGLLYTRYTRQG